MAGGLSVSSGTINDGSVDLGYEFYAWTNSADSVGVAWWIVAACEWPPDCGSGPYDFSVLSSNYATIQGHPSDQITLVMYWNTNDKMFIFDYKDPNCSSCGTSFWTVLDFTPPSYATHSFYYGIDTSCPADGIPCNYPYDNSYGSQLGITSNQQGLSNTYWEVLFSNPLYKVGSTTYYPQHSLTMGAQLGLSTNGVVMGDAWWHDNWAWGGCCQSLTTSWSDDFTVVAQTAINSLPASGQTNGQTFTATSSSRTICATVTNYTLIEQNAEAGGEGSDTISTYIANHPFLDNEAWTVDNTGPCPTDYITWTYAGGYLVPDNSALW